MCKSKKPRRNPETMHNSENELEDLNSSSIQLSNVDHDEDEAGEIFIHQFIEVIEFTLGSVSNTASYLRLWALSLAHSQLAKVFYDKTLKSSIDSGSFFGMIIVYVIFAHLTFGVLLCMDVMECFLHTLRLHWVEF